MWPHKGFQLDESGHHCKSFVHTGLKQYNFSFLFMFMFSNPWKSLKLDEECKYAPIRLFTGQYWFDCFEFPFKYLICLNTVVFWDTAVLFNCIGGCLA